MSLRKAIFWVHLAVGVTVGGVILMLAVTGVILNLRGAVEPVGATRLSR